jgi:muramoyltetrapeptide carboxypeptidase
MPRKPRALRAGALISVVSPASWLSEEKTAEGAAFLESRGYRVRLHASTRLRERSFAGTPAERALDLAQAFGDPESAAVLCARGGLGAGRVVPLVGFEALGAAGKPFIGYSDVTALHVPLLQKGGTVPFHGPMLVNFAPAPEARTADSFFRVLSGEAPSYRLDSLPAVRVLREGRAEAPIVGGNLSLLSTHIGTPWEIETRGKILFLEDVDEPLYRLERMLGHLLAAGKLDGIAGLILGECARCPDDSSLYLERDFGGIAADLLGNTSFPIVCEFPCGHGDVKLTLPLGIPFRLDTGEGTVTQLEPAVA